MVNIAVILSALRSRSLRSSLSAWSALSGRSSLTTLRLRCLCRGKNLSVHPLKDIGVALRGYSTATVVGWLDICISLLLRHCNCIVEEIAPREVSKELLARIVHTLNALEH